MARVANLSADLTCNSSRFNMNIERSRRVMRSAANDIGRNAQKVDKDISKSFTNAARNISILEGPLGGTAGRLSAIAASVKGIGFAATATAGALALVSAGILKGAAVHDTYNRSQLKTVALLRATENASGLTVRQLRSLSDEVAFATLASTEGADKAVQKLLTFTNVTGDEFKRTIRVSQDLAELGFGSIDQAVTQLGKALQDPLSGLGSLTRVGVSFSKQQKERIRILTEQNKILDAQQLILDAIEGQVTGAGEAAADSWAGALDTLNQQIERFFKAVGNRSGATGFFKDVTNSGAEILGEVAESLDPSLVAPEERLDRMLERIAEIKAELKDGSKVATFLSPLNLFSGGVNLFSELDDLENKLPAAYDAFFKEREEQEKADQARRLKQEKEASEASIANFIETQELIMKGINEFSDKKQAALQKSLNKEELELSSLNALKHAFVDLGLSIDEATILREIHNAQVSAGVAATSVEGKKLSELVRQKHELNTAIEAENKKRAEVSRQAEDYFKTLEEEQQRSQQALEYWSDGISSNLAEAIVQGESLIDVFKNLGQQIAAAALQNLLISPIVNGITGAIGGSIFGGVFGGFRAEGGPVSAGTSYIVGERGPELFTPSRSGAIVPNHQLAGTSGGTSVTVYVDASGATDPAAVDTRVREGIAAALPSIVNATRNSVVANLSRPRGAF